VVEEGATERRLYLPPGVWYDFWTEERVEEPFTLLVFPGTDGESSLYEDDGRSLGYQRGDWMRIRLSWSDADRRLTLRLADGSRRLGPMPRRFVVRVASESSTREVSFDGSPLGVHV
jgi:alpha-glucosidase (family GH31 glycosyl hydrolase)